MSSACVCHINEQFCFYCEVFSPLEEKYERLAMSVGGVIEDLAERNKATSQRMISFPVGSNGRAESYGRLSEILYLTEKLKEVLTTESDPTYQQHAAKLE